MTPCQHRPELMRTTLDLLARALEGQSNTSLAAQLNLPVNVFSKAREREHLSPIQAAGIAELVGEDVKHWTAIAALEAERPSPVRDALLRTVRRERRRLAP